MKTKTNETPGIETKTEMVGCVGEHLVLLNNDVLHNTGPQRPFDGGTWGTCACCGQPLTNLSSPVLSEHRGVRGTDGHLLFHHTTCAPPFGVSPLSKKQKRNLAKAEWLGLSDIETSRMLDRD